MSIVHHYKSLAEIVISVEELSISRVILSVDMLAVIIAGVAFLVVGIQSVSFRAPVYAMTSIGADLDQDAFKSHGTQDPLKPGVSRAHRANPIVASTLFTECS